MDSHSIVSWSTSDAKVATVENGVVTAVGNGTATITASVRPEDDEYHANTYSATATITVEFKNNNLYYYALIPARRMMVQLQQTVHGLELVLMKFQVWQIHPLIVEIMEPKRDFSTMLKRM